MAQTMTSGPTEVRSGKRQRNMGKTDRVISAMLAAYILTKRRQNKQGAGKVIALASGAMFIKRAATGHSRVYETLGISSAELGQGAGINIERSVSILASREEIFAFLRDLSNLPLVFTHLASVEVLPGEVTRWRVEGPKDQSIEWDVRIINERENEFIAWESTEDAKIREAGSVHLRDGGEWGTEVHVKLRYNPPGAGIGFAAAKLLNPATSRQVGADLRTLKRMMETGSAITAVGQPTGPQDPSKTDEPRRAVGGVPPHDEAAFPQPEPMAMPPATGESMLGEAGAPPTVGLGEQGSVRRAGLGEQGSAQRAGLGEQQTQPQGRERVDEPRETEAIDWMPPVGPAGQHPGGDQR